MDHVSRSVALLHPFEAMFDRPMRNPKGCRGLFCRSSFNQQLDDRLVSHIESFPPLWRAKHKLGARRGNDPFGPSGILLWQENAIVSEIDPHQPGFYELCHRLLTNQNFLKPRNNGPPHEALILEVPQTTVGEYFVDVEDSRSKTRVTNRFHMPPQRIVAFDRDQRQPHLY
ncbi:hypothetical protein [Sinorhizobium fredii]|uniref:hypothetical protein n=1 Tax=Rhizobium fredii TaxID=380 RepID=UPI003F7F2B2E